MIDMQEYSNKLGQFTREEISAEEWMAYCLELLSEIMEVNNDVLVRLRNN
jgi:hypothetical protein